MRREEEPGGGVTVGGAFGDDLRHAALSLGEAGPPQGGDAGLAADASRADASRADGRGRHRASRFHPHECSGEDAAVMNRPRPSDDRQAAGQVKLALRLRLARHRMAGPGPQDLLICGIDDAGSCRVCVHNMLINRYERSLSPPSCLQKAPQQGVICCRAPRHEPLLDRECGALDEREHQRVGDLCRAGEADRAHDGPGPGVGHGRRGAGQGGISLGEMLGTRHDGRAALLQ